MKRRGSEVRNSNRSMSDQRQGVLLLSSQKYMETLEHLR